MQIKAWVYCQWIMITVRATYSECTCPYYKLNDASYHWNNTEYIAGILLAGTAVSSSEEQGSGESKVELLLQWHILQMAKIWIQSKGQIPEYEEVMASRNEVPHDEPEELEMMQNVAYGPLKLHWGCVGILYTTYSGLDYTVTLRKTWYLY